MSIIKYFILLNILFFNNVYAQIDSEKSTLTKIISSEMSAARLEGTQNSSLKNYDIYYHRFNWTIDPDTFYIKGSVTTYFVIENSISDTVSFDFSNVLIVDSIVYQNKRVDYKRNNYTLDVKLNPAPTSNAKDSVSIYYKGSPVVDNRSYFKNKHRDGHIIATLSEPYGAREWWPCNQDLNDKIDSLDIYIETPSIYRAASNGLLVSEHSKGVNTIYHWKHKYPITAYLVGVAVSKYTVYSDYFIKRDDTLEVLNYVFPYYADTAKALTPFTLECLNLFDSLLIPYPFSNEKYGHAQWTLGGSGMEHQTMSFMGNFDDGLISHELAHSWFGNLVTCGSWKDIWLNEGLTTYFSGLTYQYLFSEDRWLQYKKKSIQDVVSAPDGSVYVEDTTTVERIFNGRLSYRKGAMVSHQLRWVIGDTAFFEGLRNYLSDPILKYSYAHTSDLQKHWETTSGISLENYFNDWIYGQGYPIYDYTWTQDDQNNISIQLKQQQSHPSVDLFELPLPFLLKSSQQDSLVVLNNNSNEQSFQVNLGFRVDSVILDPYYNIIHKIYGVTPTFASLLEGYVKVYPTIIDDKVYISNPANLLVGIRMYDVLGNLLIREECQESISLNIANYSNGIYIIRLEANNQIVNTKIIKH